MNTFTVYFTEHGVNLLRHFQGVHHGIRLSHEGETGAPTLCMVPVQKPEDVIAGDEALCMDGVRVFIASGSKDFFNGKKISSLPLARLSIVPAEPDEFPHLVN